MSNSVTSFSLLILLMMCATVQLNLFSQFGSCKKRKKKDSSWAGGMIKERQRKREREREKQYCVCKLTVQNYKQVTPAKMKTPQVEIMSRNKCVVMCAESDAPVILEPKCLFVHCYQCASAPLSLRQIPACLIHVTM